MLSAQIERAHVESRATYGVPRVHAELAAIGAYVGKKRVVHRTATSTINLKRSGAMALELRPNCECCDVDLPPASTEARICSYECTFCADCVENVLTNVCPNCGGGFVPRPIRPATEWRPGLSVAKRPPSDKRRSLNYSREDIAAHGQRIKGIPPERR